ncbi:MAG: DUF2752 domain-containing protein [Pseudobutyrivibrio sp.]|nr:DUF2752 domain-containing protein [Pseudobutyrivibrio sp.]
MRNARLRNLIKFWAQIGILVIVYVLVFKITGHGIPCIFRTITGLKCPGCGMTHALSAMAGGHFKEAASYNILSVSLLPILAIYLVYRSYKYTKGGEDDFSKPELVLLVLTFIAVVFYFIYRNQLLF